jgi:hypothetical protein
VNERKRDKEDIKKGKREREKEREKEIEKRERERESRAPASRKGLLALREYNAVT